MPMTPLNVADLTNTLTNILTVASWIAKFTPTTVDDNVVAGLQLVVLDQNLMASLVELINSMMSAKAAGVEFNMDKFVQGFLVHYIDAQVSKNTK